MDLQFLRDGADVKRYHTVQTLTTETVGHHSHMVAMLCLVFDPSASREMLIAALRHDLAEQVTGDLPSPTKRSLGIGDAFEDMEESLLRAAGLPRPVLSDAEWRTLKLADIASGIMFCAKERDLGNHRMSVIMHRYLDYAGSLELTSQEAGVLEILTEEPHDFS